jgi:hypothetical protein
MCELVLVWTTVFSELGDGLVFHVVEALGEDGVNDVRKEDASGSKQEQKHFTLLFGFVVRL